MLLSDLFEGLFVTDRMSAFDAIRKYPHAFVHFGEGIRHKEQRSPGGVKLGINPSKTHKDPPGIYFYYARWLLNSEEISDWQYAVNYSHYWICDIQPTANSINLATVKWATVEKLAKRNGWYETLQETLPLLAKDPAFKPLLKTVGGRFWAAMDYIANVSKKHTWSTMLRGVDALFDPGKGYITKDEPAQAIVFNPKIIRVLDHGVNKDIEIRKVAQAMRKVADEMGGIFEYKNRAPVIRVTVDGKHIKLAWMWDRFRTGMFKDGVWVEKDGSRFYSSVSLEWLEKNIRDIIRFTAKHDAEETGRISLWNRAKIKQICKAISNNNIPIVNENTRPGGILEFSSGSNGWGGIQFFVRFIAQPDDTLAAEMYIGTRSYDLQIRALGEYPPHSRPEDIALDMLAQFDQQLDALVKEGKLANKAKFIAVSGLRL